jgi:uncharacterized membrane protein YcaP (DUF421 family)
MVILWKLIFNIVIDIIMCIFICSVNFNVIMDTHNSFWVINTVIIVFILWVIFSRIKEFCRVIKFLYLIEKLKEIVNEKDTSK